LEIVVPLNIALQEVMTYQAMGATCSDDSVFFGESFLGMWVYFKGIGWCEHDT
jgi:hypothetical protein